MPDTSTHRPTVQDAIESAFKWRFASGSSPEDGFEVLIYRDGSQDNQPETFVYTCTELAEVDPRLVEILTHLITHHSDNAGTLDGPLLYYSQRLLRGEELCYEDRHGEQYHLGPIFDVTTVGVPPGNLDTHLLVVPAVFRVEDGPFGKMATRLDFDTLLLPNSWLEQHYPGCVAKVKAALAIGMSSADTASLVFSNASTSTSAGYLPLPDQLS